MVNIPNRDSIANFSSDLINKICNGFGVFQRLNIELKKVGSSEFFSRK